MNKEDFAKDFLISAEIAKNLKDGTFENDFIEKNNKINKIKNSYMNLPPEIKEYVPEEDYTSLHEGFYMKTSIELIKSFYEKIPHPSILEYFLKEHARLFPYGKTDDKYECPFFSCIIEVEADKKIREHCVFSFLIDKTAEHALNTITQIKKKVIREYDKSLFNFDPILFPETEKKTRVSLCVFYKEKSNENKVKNKRASIFAKEELYGKVIFTIEGATLPMKEFERLEKMNAK
jgi:hypothetical protein